MLNKFFIYFFNKYKLDKIYTLIWKQVLKFFSYLLVFCNKNSKKVIEKIINSIIIIIIIIVYYKNFKKDYKNYIKNSLYKDNKIIVIIKIKVINNYLFLY